MRTVHLGILFIARTVPDFQLPFKLISGKRPTAFLIYHAVLLYCMLKLQLNGNFKNRPKEHLLMLNLWVQS